MIQPNQFNLIKEQIVQLVRTYQSVNDPQTVRTIEEMTKDVVNSQFDSEDSQALLIVNEMFQRGLSIKKAEAHLSDLKNFVEPFKAPSVKQTEKLFRKVKKLKIPDFEQFDLKETTYLAWDDIGSQSKFMIAAGDDGYTAVHGHMSTEVKKGICPICQHEGNVSMFLSLTKSSGDGTYTKRGNYICRDSQRCNQKLTDKALITAFLSLVKMKEK